MSLCEIPHETVEEEDACERRYTERDMAAAQDSEVAALIAGHVLVPRKGEWLVRDGKITEIVETDLKGTNSEHWTYEVWIDTPVEGE